MSPLEIINSPNVSLIDGQAVTSSKDVADYFGKLHKNVLRLVESLLEESTNFSQLNFEPAGYIDEQGKPRKAYNMSRDGFTLLAMRFTGKKATKFQIAYIEAFNAMDEALKDRNSQPHPTPPPQLPPKQSAPTTNGLEDYALNQLQQQFALGRVDVEAKVQLCSIIAADRVADLFRSLLQSASDPRYTPPNR